MQAGVPIVCTSLGRNHISLLCLWRIWRLLLIRGPPSDSDGETPRLINGVVQSPQQLWDVGCRIYMTAVPNVFWAWRTEAEWRADWRGVLYKQLLMSGICMCGTSVSITSIAPYTHVGVAPARGPGDGRSRDGWSSGRALGRPRYDGSPSWKMENRAGGIVRWRRDGSN